VVAAAVVLDPNRIPKASTIPSGSPPSAVKSVRGDLRDISLLVAVARRARIDRGQYLPRLAVALARSVHALPEMPKHVFVDGRDRLATPATARR